MLSYDETQGAIAGALKKDEREVGDTLSLMESLNLIELKDSEKGKKMIHLIEKDCFLEKALNIFNVLKRYQSDR